MTKISSPITLILLISVFSISTCTTDNSVTGNSDQYLLKPSGAEGVNTKFEDLSDEEQCYYWFFAFNPLAAIMMGYNPPGHLDKPYDFRDNYLEKSNKGLEYKSAYYELGRYAIKNNLVNTYFKEHHLLLLESAKIAFELQYSNDNTKILIQDDISSSLKEMVTIYREHPNHREIDKILDYLESDLIKYENKPKSVIEADFETNE